MYSDTVEDYLKTIYLLEDRHGVAKTGAIAERLHITAGSVSSMVKRMAEMSPPLVAYRQHHGAVLTDTGRQAALEIIRRHRLLETFLYRALDFDWEAVHEEAERLEHHLSERMVGAIDRFLGHPRRDPHGEQIPSADGQMAPERGQTLSRWPTDDPFRVVRVAPRAGMLAHLDQLGIGIGTTGRVISRAPFDGPITLCITENGNCRETVIGREVAASIYVLEPKIA